MRYIWIAIALLFFVGCSQKELIIETVESERATKFQEEGSYALVADHISLNDGLDGLILEGELEKIYFRYGTAIIEKKYFPAIEKHAQFLKQNSKLRLIIQGNADFGGEVSANVWIAENRARNVKARLVKHGIEPSRIEVATNSRDNPAVPHSNIDEWDKNRRVEFVYY